MRPGALPVVPEADMVEAISVAQLQALMASAKPPLLCDVRRQPAFLASPMVIAGAVRRLPETVATWGAQLGEVEEVVVYCVHGHEVSQGVAAQLVERGVRCRYLFGGIEQWLAEGGPIVAPAD
jgi:thiosulfate sulfurtransferase